MCKALLFWQNAGVDGFRADAIPYIWKEEGTECENLPQTHLVVKFFRAILDYIKPDHSCLPKPASNLPKWWNIWAMATNAMQPIISRLCRVFLNPLPCKAANLLKKHSQKHLHPNCPPSGQWFTFLRCHDELSLELVYVTEEERKYIHQQYCLKPEWDFRLGEGISARLSELMQRDERRILLAYSIILNTSGNTCYLLWRRIRKI